MCRTHSRNRTQHFLVNPVKVLQKLKTGNLKSLAENHFSGRIPYPQTAQLFLSFCIQLDIKFFKCLADNHLGSRKYWITLAGFTFTFTVPMPATATFFVFPTATAPVPARKKPFWTAPTHAPTPSVFLIRTRTPHYRTPAPKILPSREGLTGYDRRVFIFD